MMKNFKTIALTPLALVLFSGTLFANLPGKVIIDNESNNDLAITVQVYINDNQYYQFSTDQITADNVLKSLHTDGILKNGIGGKDNIKIHIVGSNHIIEQNLNPKRTEEYTINNNGKESVLSITTAVANRKFNADQLTGFDYHIVINDNRKYPKTDEAINESALDDPDYYENAVKSNPVSL